MYELQELQCITKLDYLARVRTGIGIRFPPCGKIVAILLYGPFWGHLASRLQAPGMTPAKKGPLFICVIRLSHHPFSTVGIRS